MKEARYTKGSALRAMGKDIKKSGGEAWMNLLFGIQKDKTRTTAGFDKSSMRIHIRSNNKSTQQTKVERKKNNKENVKVFRSLENLTVVVGD